MPDNGDLATEMRRHADAAVVMVKEEFNAELDFSDETIVLVEAILEAFCKDEDRSPELIRNISLLFGGYIGEIICQSFSDAHWLANPDAEGSPIVQIVDIQLFPCSWCYKRVFNGPSDSVIEKYQAFLDEVESRFPVNDIVAAKHDELQQDEARDPSA